MNEENEENESWLEDPYVKRWLDKISATTKNQYKTTASKRVK